MGRKLLLDPKTDALLLVDVQGAFMTGGGLAVKDAEAILPIITRLKPHFDLVWASVDRHPKGHVSLVSSYMGYEPLHLLTYEEVKDWDAINQRIRSGAAFSLETLKAYLKETGVQVLWPDHAVDGSGEDELHVDVADIHGLSTVVKGTAPACDSYSAFTDNLGRPTGLAEDMRSRGVKRVFVCGLAEDFCVGWSALDAKKEGFETFVIRDGTRPVDTPADENGCGSLERIRRAFSNVGIRYVDSAKLSSY